MSTTWERVLQVCHVCGYPTPASLARASGLAGQNAYLWKRGASLGSAAANKLVALTGVDRRWLLTGEGEPFPAGPYRPPQRAREGDLQARLSAVEAELAELKRLVGTMLASQGVAVPDLADPAAARAVPARRRRSRSARQPQRRASSPTGG